MKKSISVELTGKYYADYLQKIQQRMQSPWNLHGIHHRHLNQFIQNEVLKLPDRAEVLDGGCGLSIWVTPEIDRKIKYTGVDCQQDAIEFCQKNFTGRKYYMADLYNLPFPDHSFNMVVMREVIEHVKMPDKLLKEICRLLKPDGVFVMTTPNYGSRLLFLIENIYNRFFSELKPYLEDVHPVNLSISLYPEFLKKISKKST